MLELKSDERVGATSPNSGEYENGLNGWERKQGDVVKGKSEKGIRPLMALYVMLSCVVLWL